jgi:hypothetical protein
MAALGGCLIDFHAASLQSDRKEMLGSALDAITEQDALTADLPEVALAEPGGAGWPNPGNSGLPGVPDMPGPEFPDPTTPSGYGVDPPYPTTEVNPAVEELVQQIIDGDEGPPDDFPGGECPGGIPGEQCGPF